MSTNPSPGSLPEFLAVETPDRGSHLLRWNGARYIEVGHIHNIHTADEIARRLNDQPAPGPIAEQAEAWRAIRDELARNIGLGERYGLTAEEQTTELVRRLVDIATDQTCQCNQAHVCAVHRAFGTGFDLPGPERPADLDRART
jgi:hypothetical protein